MKRERPSLGNPTGTVAPGDLVICRDQWAIVTKVITHPIGSHTDKIVNGYIPIEVQTEHGSRWLGAHKAFINSSLRMEWSR